MFRRQEFYLGPWKLLEDAIRKEVRRRGNPGEVFLTAHDLIRLLAPMEPDACVASVFGADELRSLLDDLVGEFTE